jgi:hypothetical protein
MNEKYLFEIIKSDNFSLIEVLQHFELFIISGDKISPKLLNYLLNKYPEALEKEFYKSYFNPHYEESFSRRYKYTLLSEMVNSLYINGEKNYLRQSRNIKTLLNSNAVIDWKKNPHYINEVIWGRHFENIKGVLDQVEDLNKLKLSGTSLSSLGTDLKMMKYLFKRKYHFSNDTRLESIEWLSNFFICNSEKKIPKKWLSKFLDLVKNLSEKDLFEKREFILSLFEFFYKMNNFKEMLRYVNLNDIDYLIETCKSNKIINIYNILLELRNLKNKNHSYFTPSYYYTDMEKKLINSNFNYKKIGIKNVDYIKYLNSSMRTGRKMLGLEVVNSSDYKLESYLVLQSRFKEISEERLFKLFLKYFDNEVNRRYYSPIIEILSGDKSSYFKDLEEKKLYELLFNTTYDILKETERKIEAISRRNSKYRENLEIRITNEFKSFSSILDYLTFLDESNRIYLKDNDLKLQAIDGKTINEYEIEIYRNNFKDFLTDYFVKFPFTEKEFSPNYRGSLLLLKKDNEVKDVILIDTVDKTFISLGNKKYITFEKLEELYDCNNN